MLPDGSLQGGSGPHWFMLPYLRPSLVHAGMWGCGEFELVMSVAAVLAYSVLQVGSHIANENKIDELELVTS